MEHVIQTEYGIQAGKVMGRDKKEGYSDGTYLYFFTTPSESATVDMEQATLAYHLTERNYQQTALPIPKKDGDWYATVEDKQYLLMRVNEPTREWITQTGLSLAQFHLASADYTFMPKEISSYGQWHTLWTNKLTMFESHLERAAEEYRGTYYSQVMDILPYVIGRGENAIQYMHETQSDPRYNEGDRGAICFRRFTNGVLTPIIWPSELVYDHPVRDIAEYLRNQFLNGTEEELCRQFLADYQSLKRLSVFSMRMLYARLLYPADLLDCLEEGLSTTERAEFPSQPLNDLIRKQDDYEKQLRRLFQSLGIDEQRWQIPVVHWL